MSILNDNNPELIIFKQIHNNTWVDERFYNQVLQLIREIMPALEQGQRYTVKLLCGDTFWNSLKNGETKLAGKCVVDMVRKKLLPLRFAGATNKNWRLYQL